MSSSSQPSLPPLTGPSPSTTQSINQSNNQSNDQIHNHNQPVLPGVVQSANQSTHLPTIPVATIVPVSQAIHPPDHHAINPPNHQAITQPALPVLSTIDSITQTVFRAARVVNQNITMPSVQRSSSLPSNQTTTPSISLATPMAIVNGPASSSGSSRKKSKQDDVYEPPRRKSGRPKGTSARQWNAQMARMKLGPMSAIDRIDAAPSTQPADQWKVPVVKPMLPNKRPASDGQDIPPFYHLANQPLESSNKRLKVENIVDNMPVFSIHHMDSSSTQSTSQSNQSNNHSNTFGTLSFPTDNQASNSFAPTSQPFLPNNQNFQQFPQSNNQSQPSNQFGFQSYMMPSSTSSYPSQSSNQSQFSQQSNSQSSNDPSHQSSSHLLDQSNIQLPDFYSQLGTQPSLPSLSNNQPSYTSQSNIQQPSYSSQPNNQQSYFSQTNNAPNPNHFSQSSSQIPLINLAMNHSTNQLTTQSVSQPVTHIDTLYDGDDESNTWMSSPLPVPPNAAFSLSPELQSMNQQSFNQESTGQPLVNQQSFNQQPIDQQPVNQHSINQQPIIQPSVSQPTNQPTLPTIHQTSTDGFSQAYPQSYAQLPSLLPSEPMPPQNSSMNHLINQSMSDPNSQIVNPMSDQLMFQSTIQMKSEPTSMFSQAFCFPQPIYQTINPVTSVEPPEQPAEYWSSVGRPSLRSFSKAAQQSSSPPPLIAHTDPNAPRPDSKTSHTRYEAPPVKHIPGARAMALAAQKRAADHAAVLDAQSRNRAARALTGFNRKRTNWGSPNVIATSMVNPVNPAPQVYQSPKSPGPPPLSMHNITQRLSSHSASDDEDPSTKPPVDENNSDEVMLPNEELMSLPPLNMPLNQSDNQTNNHSNDHSNNQSNSQSIIQPATPSHLRIESPSPTSLKLTIKQTSRRNDRSSQSNKQSINATSADSVPPGSTSHQKSTKQSINKTSKQEISQSARSLKKQHIDSEVESHTNYNPPPTKFRPGMKRPSSSISNSQLIDQSNDQEHSSAAFPGDETGEVLVDEVHNGTSVQHVIDPANHSEQPESITIKQDTSSQSTNQPTKQATSHSLRSRRIGSRSRSRSPASTKQDHEISSYPSKLSMPQNSSVNQTATQSNNPTISNASNSSTSHKRHIDSVNSFADDVNDHKLNDHDNQSFNADGGSGATEHHSNSWLNGRGRKHASLPPLDSPRSDHYVDRYDDPMIAEENQHDYNMDDMGFDVSNDGSSSSRAPPADENSQSNNQSNDLGLDETIFTDQSSFELAQARLGQHPVLQRGLESMKSIAKERIADAQARFDQVVEANRKVFEAERQSIIDEMRDVFREWQREVVKKLSQSERDLKHDADARMFMMGSVARRETERNTTQERSYRRKFSEKKGEKVRYSLSNRDIDTDLHRVKDDLRDEWGWQLVKDFHVQRPGSVTVNARSWTQFITDTAPVDVVDEEGQIVRAPEPKSHTVKVADAIDEGEETEDEDEPMSNNQS